MALKWLRDQFKHLKIILWAVVAIFILLVFVDWGAGRSGGRGRGDDVAIRIGEKVVSEEEFLRELKQNQDRFREIYGRQWEQVRQQLDLADHTSQQLIRRELMLEEANRLGLRVSNRELQDEIMSYPVFQREGGGFVGAEAYGRILRANRTSPGRFEASLREDLQVRKLTELVEGGVVVSDAEVEERFRREREVCDLDVLLVRFENFLERVQVGDGEVQAYYEQHADEMRREEQRVLRYLLVDTNKLRRQLPVEDSGLEEYYQKHQDEFMEGEQVKARHILFRVPQGAEAGAEAEAQVKAQAVAEMARTGADFATLAAKHSEDAATKDNGGDLGWFGRGSMVKEFEDAVYGATPGEVVGPVRSEFGFHVIRVDERRAQRVPPLAEVRERVRFKVLEGRAAAEAEQRASRLAEQVRTAKPQTDEEWQKIADQDEAVVLNVSPPFGREQAIPGIGQDAELNRQVFAASVGYIGGPRSISRGWAVWQLKEVKPEGVPPLDEVKQQVEQKVRRGKAVDLAVAAASGVVSRWRSGEDPKTIAAGLGSEVTQAADHRRGAAIPGVGSVPTLDQRAFAAVVGEVVGPVEVADRGAVVARVQRVVRADPDQLAGEREGLRQRLARERATQLLESVLGERRQQTTVEINKELMQRFAPEAG